jgi:site-specific DNA recombinase
MAMTWRTGKGGRYRYYACSTKARQGETGCKGRTVPMEKLDRLVADHIELRLLQPNRLEKILSSVLDRREERTERRATHIAELRKRATEADAKLKRLYDAIENGVTDLSDLMLKERITELKAIRDHARADAERAEGAIDRLGPTINYPIDRDLCQDRTQANAHRGRRLPVRLSPRARPAGRSRRARTSHHGIEKRTAAHPRRRFKRKKWRARNDSNIRPQLSIQVVNWDSLRRNIADGDECSALRITIESSRRTQLRRFHAATFLLPLPRRFHERNLEPKSGQQKALENYVFSRACCLVAGIGFEPMTFRL